MAKVKVYTTPTCPWCVKVKTYLKSKNVPYVEVNVAADEKAQEEMIEKSGQMGVPVLDINGTIIIGYDVDAIDQAIKEMGGKKAKAA